MRTIVDWADDFQSIAQDYLNEHTQGGGVLRRYIERYPHYTEELTMLALEMAADDGDAPSPLTPPSHLFDRLREEARDAEPRTVAPLAPVPPPPLPPAPAPPDSLIDFAGDHNGLDPVDLAERLDVGIDVLTLLDERHVPAHMIYPAFYAMGAEALGVPQEWIEAYFVAPPRAADFATAYHAPHGLAGMQPRTFGEAIEESPLMTPEQKARWRARAPRDGDA